MNTCAFCEPSACAAVHGAYCWNHSEEMQNYIYDNHLKRHMENATHIIWATGGSLVPDKIRQEMLEKKV